MRFKELFAIDRMIIDYGGRLIYLSHPLRVWKMRKILKENVNLSKFKRSDTCFIIGLGPSFKAIDIEKLNNHPSDKLVVNAYYKVDTNQILDVNYYVTVDNGFLKEKYIDGFRDILSSFPKAAHIMSPQMITADVVKEYDCPKFGISCTYGIFNANRKIDLTKPMPGTVNCVSTSIEILLALGYKKIILLGCDFNSFATPTEVHCYEEEHVKNAVRLNNLAQDLYCSSFTARGHMELENYAQKHGVTILNATRRSLIDAYKRIDIPEIYK